MEKHLGGDIMCGALRMVGKLPLGFHYGCSRGISWLVAHVMHYRESVVYINLARSFPEKKYVELRHMVQDFYRHFGEIIAEAIWFAAATPERLKKS